MVLAFSNNLGGFLPAGSPLSNPTYTPDTNGGAGTAVAPGPSSQNAATNRSQLRTPRGIVQINGVRVPFVSCEVNNNVFYAADTFRVNLAPSALPATMDLAALAAAGELMVEIWVGFPADPTNFTTSGLTSLVYGKADTVSWHIDVNDHVVELNGRDLTAGMIDTKTVEKYPNLTSSQIAQKIAANHGLATEVTATTTKVGKYYEIDHIQLQDDKTEWDLLTYLARQEKFVVYVEGKTLYFQPEPTETSKPYVFEIALPSTDAPARANFTALKVEHTKTLANDLQVIVHSWDRKNAKGYTVKATASHVKRGLSPTNNVVKKGTTEIRSFIVPNLSKAQAQDKANQLLAEISKHEMKIEVSGPADVRLTRIMPIQLKGTGTAFDQIYYPVSIARSLSPIDGFQWQISAKNQSPETTVIA